MGSPLRNRACGRWIAAWPRSLDSTRRQLPDRAESRRFHCAGGASDNRRLYRAGRQIHLIGRGPHRLLVGRVRRNLAFIEHAAPALSGGWLFNHVRSAGLCRCSQGRELAIGSGLAESERIQVCISEHESQADWFARHRAHVGPRFPRNNALKGVPEYLGTVCQGEICERLAVNVLHLNANAACSRRGEIQRELFALEQDRPGDQCAAGQGRLHRHESIDTNRPASVPTEDGVGCDGPRGLLKGTLTRCKLLRSWRLRTSCRSCSFQETFR